MRRLVPSVLVLGLLVAGCASSSSWSPTVSPTPERLAEPLTFYNALEADQDREEKYWATMPDELGIVLSDEVRTDAYGSWHPLTVSLDAPLLDIDPEVLSDGLDPSWTSERLQEAWRAVAEFIVNEHLDSELVWDDTPANRQTVADRVESEGLFAWDDRRLVSDFSGFFEDKAWSRGLSSYGSYIVDHDYNGWRQAGGVPGHDNEYLTPANPVPYSLEEPRTLVVAMGLAGIAQGELPGEINTDAYVGYIRPIRVDGAEGRRYEVRHARISLQIMYADGPRVTFIEHIQRSHPDDHAVVSNETRRRLPLLDETPVDGWAAHEISGLSLRLPASATPDTDEACEYQPDESRPGQTLRLERGVEGRAGCVRVVSWTPEKDDEPQTEIVQVNETIWGAQAPGLLGTVDVRVYKTHDTVDFYLTEGPGPCYQITADVPPGTGEQFARQMLSTLDASAAPLPSPSRT